MVFINLKGLNAQECDPIHSVDTELRIKVEVCSRRFRSRAFCIHSRIQEPFIRVHECTEANSSRWDNPIPPLKNYYQN